MGGTGTFNQVTGDRALNAPGMPKSPAKALAGERRAAAGRTVLRPGRRTSCAISEWRRRNNSRKMCWCGDRPDTGLPKLIRTMRP